MNTFDEQTDFSFLAIAEQKCPVVAKKKVSATPRSSTVSVTYTFDRSYQKTAEYRQQMSNTQKGREVPWHKGVPLSDKHKASLSKAMKGKTAHNKGVKFSEVASKRISEANPHRRQVMTPDGVFPSMRAAQRHYNVASSTMHSWMCMKSKPEFYYIEETV